MNIKCLFGHHHFTVTNAVQFLDRVQLTITCDRHCDYRKVKWVSYYEYLAGIF